jgi:hypothetical protein
MPSPILPDGRLVPLPIPSKSDHFSLADINVPNLDLDQLLSDLSQGVHTPRTRIHLDPDLDRSAVSRLPGWRPALGQSGAAQSHLRDKKIGVGDLFLFFGWFRQVEIHAGVWRYVRSAPHVHVIFGWLEVAHVLPVVTERERCLRSHPWIANHPHVADPARYTDARNTLYVAPKGSRFSKSAIHGGGRFLQFGEQLQLTRSGSTRSVWSLPAWFMPKKGRAPLSYNPRPDQWETDSDHVVLRSAAKGQEFVLDAAEYPEAESWASELIQEHA